MNNYFPHDSNARNSSRIIKLRMKHKAAGYGVYFMILERLRESENFTSNKDYNIIAFDLREDAALIKSIVEDFGLFTFTDDGNSFFSEELTERMKRMENTKKKLSDAGKAGSEKRWHSNSHPIATLSKNDSHPNNTLIATPCNLDSNKIKINKNNNIKENTTKVVSKKSSRFSPPTFEELKNYISEKGFSVDADRFFNFYESKGWFVGKNKMKDWKAAVRTWNAKEPKTIGFDTGVVLTDNSITKYAESWQ